ncbi:acid-sensing ion channel 1 isoform X2 [Brachionus plicatilis]|uniref:Acid-sensing ion channel 1 isoform X2 n=1 Tax=Brachionus plicatilis TaxID=10195 RepID=A0A3M7RXQ3_BRAPC|nr:acid-sensing ion channel 1 isoform X2 [Brachionus plicatilis]
MDPKKSSLKQVLMKRLRDFLNSSTNHGFSHMLKSDKRLLRIIWIAFTILSTGLCAFMINEKVMNFFKYEVTTKTRIINQYKANFPTITICNMNFFTSEFSINFSKKFIKQKIVYNPFTIASEYFIRSEAINNVIHERYKDVYGDSMNKLIADCQFELVSCNRSQIKFFYHPNYGNCYQFNSGFDGHGEKMDLKNLTMIDRVAGLRLVLNLSTPNTLKLINPNIGGVVFIHNHTTYPLMVDGVTLAPKTETNIALSRTFFQLKEKPYSSCDIKTSDPNYLDSNAYRLVHNQTYGYAQTLCVYQCIQNFLMDKCKCIYFMIPSFSNLNTCFNSTNIECFSRYLNNSNDFLLIYEKCFEECPLECSGMWFDKIVSFNHFSSSKYQELFENYNGTEKIYLNRKESFDDIAIVNIYYRSLSYTQISENPTIEIVDLFSSVGGIGGLFLGISVLTLVEFVELLFIILAEIKDYKKPLACKNTNIFIYSFLKKEPLN